MMPTVSAVKVARQPTENSEYNVAWAEAYSTSVPSGILVHPTVWPQQIWAAVYTVGKPRKWVLLFHFLWGGAGSPYNTNVAWAEAYLCTNGILIHPTV